MSWHAYTSYTALYCYKYWLKRCTYTCGCYGMCWRHPEVCLHAWTQNSSVHLYLMHELLFTDILSNILVSQHWIQDRLHLMDWSWSKNTTHKRQIWYLTFANPQAIAMHTCAYTHWAERLEEEYWLMERGGACLAKQIIYWNLLMNCSSKRITLAC